jgi:hypothetical protein
MQSYIYVDCIVSWPGCSIAEVLLQRVFAFVLEMARACWTLFSGRALDMLRSNHGVVPYLLFLVKFTVKPSLFI